MVADIEVVADIVVLRLGRLLVGLGGYHVGELGLAEPLFQRDERAARAGVGGVEPQGLAQRSQRFLALAARLENERHLMVRARLLRRAPHTLARHDQRLFQAGHDRLRRTRPGYPCQRLGERVVRHPRLGFEAHRLPCRGDRLVDAPAAEERQRQHPVRVGQLGRQLDGPAGRFERPLGFLGVEMGQHEPRPRRRVVGLFRDSLRQQRGCLLGAVGVEQQLGLLDEGTVSVHSSFRFLR